jgi:maltokinase
MGLDEAGFNHLAAPVARWQRAGRDLGIVQEVAAGRADGWSLALVSLRDLFGSGVAPEDAGGDFAPEAHALGTMAGRMHVALDRAFGRRGGSVTGWMDEVEQVVNEADPGLLSKSGADKAIEALREARLSGTALRTHGDFHLGRTARTDQGWVLADCEPGGQPAWADAPLYRSPLADVADMVWSFHHVAGLAAQEREPDDSGAFRAAALAWESRNRRAFMVGYLAVPGIGGLVPTDRDVIRNLAAVFEIERAARLSLLDASM